MTPSCFSSSQLLHIHWTSMTSCRTYKVCKKINPSDQPERHWHRRSAVGLPYLHKIYPGCGWCALLCIQEAMNMMRWTHETLTRSKIQSNSRKQALSSPQLSSLCLVCFSILSIEERLIWIFCVQFLDIFWAWGLHFFFKNDKTGNLKCVWILALQKP